MVAWLLKKTVYMQYDAIAASRKKIRTSKLSAWNRNSKAYKKKHKTLLTIPAERSERKEKKIHLHFGM